VDQQLNDRSTDGDHECCTIVGFLLLSTHDWFSSPYYQQLGRVSSLSCLDNSYKKHDRGNRETLQNQAVKRMRPLTSYLRSASSSHLSLDHEIKEERGVGDDLEVEDL